MGHVVALTAFSLGPSSFSTLAAEGLPVAHILADTCPRPVPPFWGPVILMGMGDITSDFALRSPDG